MNSTLTRSWLVLACALVAQGLPACADEAIEPVPTATPTSSVPTDGGGGQGGEAPNPRVREVYARNPFGGPFDNLLADGDFELSIVPEGASGQYGWIAFTPSFQPESILAETGGLCRSGLRCGRVPDRTVLFARGTAAAEEIPHRASIWMKPVDAPDPKDEAPCDLANVRVIRCSSFDQVERLEPAEKPDADGWCQFSGEVPGSRVGLCMYIDIRDKAVLVDHATLVAAPDLVNKDGAPNPLPITSQPKETADQMQKVRDIIRKRTPIGDLPPPPSGEPSRPD
ncbi:MAG: hypothetical protein HOW73_40780 [Polyangiaceae bacterium]|nr:hypothetical protein [Polyangiaceae bacterium]